MKNKNGFTLVEMLVVIAIIGILSATLLTALGPARNKAKDARIISSLNQIRAIAETLYDGDYSAVEATQRDIANASADITQNGGTLHIDKEAPPLNFRAWADLSTGDKWYCIDSAGKGIELSVEPAAGSALCP